MPKNWAIPLPYDGKLDEACFSMFLWVCFQLLTIKTFFVSLRGVMEVFTPLHRTESLNQMKNKTTMTKG
jgi:hypothetical protein